LERRIELSCGCTATQFGAWGKLTQSSYAFAVEAGYRLTDTPWKPWVRLGYTLGSGDGNKADTVKVLYIAGSGRSGSTILDNILGQVEGGFSVGELRYVWDRGIIQNRICGCGAPFRGCNLWKRVFDNGFGGFDGIDANRMLALRDQCDPTRSLAFTRSMNSQALDAYRPALQRLYNATSTIMGHSTWPRRSTAS
jgi:hypothetical protein